MNRSDTRFLIHLNTELLILYSKKQSMIEMCTFSTRFVAMKTDLEYLQDIHDKLHKMGISIDGPNYVYGGSTSVINNTSYL